MKYELLSRTVVIIETKPLSAFPGAPNLVLRLSSK